MGKKVLGEFTLPDEGDIIDQISGQQEVSRIKDKVDFLTLLKGWGFAVKQNGRGHMILCPFHEDTKPSCSIEPAKKIFHCFGCGKKGDIIDFVRHYRKTDFRGALDLLQQKDSHVTPALPKAVQKSILHKSTKTKVAKPVTQATAHLAAKTVAKLTTNVTPKQPAQAAPKQEPPLTTLSLDTIADYYHKKLMKSRKAVAYLKARGLTNRELYTRFRIGYCDGSLQEKLSTAQKQELQSLGILRESGREHFSGYLIFPITTTANKTVNLYGRSLSASNKIPHLYLPGSHRGIFNSKACKVYTEIFLAESVIDALSLIQAGLQNVQAIYGTNGFTAEHLQHLKDCRVKQVAVALDNDNAGRKAATDISAKLVSAGINVKLIFPSGKDWNKDLVACGVHPEQLAETVKTKMAEASQANAVSTTADFAARKQGAKYLFKVNGVSYRLSGVKPAFVSSLRVNIKAEKNDERFLDNADLYSARSRTSLSQHLSRLFVIPEQRLENDLLAIVDWLETERDRGLMEDETSPRELTAEETQLGLDLLTSPELFPRIVSDLALLGYVGEDLNKQLIYLAASSRKLADPISVMILSQSASGKSLLVETVRKLIPPQDVVAVSSLSDQALNYMSEGGLLHKYLILGEAVHSEVVEHQIREMLSNHELSRMVTSKNEKSGQMETRIIKTRVVVSAMLSSTRYDVNPENASRCFVINTDESRAQTRDIHQAQKRKYSLTRLCEKQNDIPAIIAQHHAAQRLLKGRIINNPLGEFLDFPDSLMRTRRDHERFIDLIAAVCFLRQYQKEEYEGTNPVTGDVFQYLTCDIEDYRIAYKIIKGILPATISSFPKGATMLYAEIRTLVKRKATEEGLRPEEVQISQRQIREATSFSQMAVKRNVRLLVDYEYLQRNGKRGRGSRSTYSLTADEDIHLLDLSMIPTPEEILRRMSNKRE